MKSLRPLAALLLGSVLLAAEPAPPQDRGDAWSDPRNPIRTLFGGQRLDLWSLRPIRHLIPPPAAPGASAHPIDRFLAAGPDGASPGQSADRRTLIRRLSFDLTGLPPAPESVAAFESDGAPDAYERLVDRLLSSPQYGEHQARLWMDVIRYSDSNGFDWDEFRPRAWRFRDYLIRAFNRDRPFDQLVREQLAGDELVPGEPRNAEEQDAWIATGYLRLGPQDNAAPLFNEQDRSRNELLSDLVETTAGAFLGLTYGCCRCHDHKFDPLSQADHYRLRAFFEPVAFADQHPLDLAPEQDRIRRHNADLDALVSDVERRRETVVKPVRVRLRGEREARLEPADRDLLAKAETGLPADLKERVARLRKKLEPSEPDLTAALTEADQQAVQALRQELAALAAQRREFTSGWCMTDGRDTPATTRVLFQGNHRSPREPVEPGFPSVLDPRPARLRPSANPATTGRRLSLADWIVSPANPLTARVFVNRIWQQHFGTGLVETPNDFGLAGALPSQPELLDWLADEFLRDGWSVKRLHRRIVTSAAYRAAPQAAATTAVSGPRPAARRLSAEQLRDSLLVTAGTLQFRAGGPPVWPELPPEVLQANPAFLDDNETRTKGWYPSPADQQAVRSVYLVQKRTVRVPFLETFDLPENSTSCARRTESTVAPQALSLLNSPAAVAAARALATRVERLAGTEPAAQVEMVFRLALQRKPADDERELCRAALARRSLPEFCRVILNLNEFVYVD